MPYLNLDTFRSTPLRRNPFEFLVVPDFLCGESKHTLSPDYPVVARPGSYPASEVAYGPSFRALLDELQGPEFETAVEEKFGIELGAYPTMVTLRGRCRKKDGRIHTDSKSKIITALVYMNEGWKSDCGRLRLLRSRHDLDDMVTEVSPEWGTLLVFRRTENSFHGHRPFVGERRSIQLNWVTDHAEVERQIARHRMSARVKRLIPFI
ncbi:MAG: 2OG-Fe(II) oxygenase [Acidiferrobacterales bacterium]